MERTVVMLKPDCVTRGLVGEVVTRFERKSLKIVAMKMMKLKRSTLDAFYPQHKGKPFFDQLVRFMRKTPVVVMVVEGVNAIETVRKIVGITVGREAAAGTIRGDFSMSTRSNIIHIADTPEMAEREMNLLFKPKEIYEYKSVLDPICYTEEELEIKEAHAAKPRKIPGKEEELQ